MMDFEHPVTLWLIVAAVFIAVEAIGMPGIGFFFAGMAALLTGLAVHLGWIEMSNHAIQLTSFLGLTFVFAVVLWKPLKKWRTTSSSGQVFNNMVGDIAVIMEEGLSRGKRGQVNWSGTTMYAELSDDCKTDRLEGGVLVEIQDVKGNVLIVAPKT